MANSLKIQLFWFLTMQILFLQNKLSNIWLYLTFIFCVYIQFKYLTKQLNCFCWITCSTLDAQTDKTLWFGVTSDCLFLSPAPEGPQSCLSQSCMFTPRHWVVFFNNGRKYTNHIITLKYCYLYTLKLFQTWTGPPVVLMSHRNWHSHSVRGTFVGFLTGKQAGGNKW